MASLLLLDFVKIIERNLDVNANLKLLQCKMEMYLRLVLIFELKIGYSPNVKIDEGMYIYINWFKKYYYV